MEKPEQLLEKLKEAVLNCDPEASRRLAEEAVSAGLDPVKAVQDGLAKGIAIIGEKFGCGEVFLPDLMVAANAMSAGVEVLRAALAERNEVLPSIGKVILGTVEGDVHSIGKTIVGSMLFAAGFEVIDIGEDIPAGTFVEKVREVKPDIVGASALMTTTLPGQQELVEALKRAELRDRVKIIIGGAATSREWAAEIGADGWAPDAMEAVAKAKELVGKK